LVVLQTLLLENLAVWTTLHLRPRLRAGQGEGDEESMTGEQEFSVYVLIPLFALINYLSGWFTSRWYYSEQAKAKATVPDTLSAGQPE
jgi:hypothetical protein